jgi:uncharacterized coiled-coil protein SlyX
MTVRRIAVLALSAVCLSSLALAQPAQPIDPPLVNWTAPPYWTPTRATPQEGQPGRGIDVQALGIEAGTMSLPSSPVPFVAIAPCRIVDTRVSNPDGFHEPNFADGETRTYTFPNSTGCPGLPANSVAYSVNVQFRPMTVSAYITLYPAGTSLPLVSTTVGNPAGFVTDAAIVPAGTGGAIDVYCQYAGRVVIDINGYYVPENVVNTLNTKTGDVTLAPGSNVTITPSGNTLTIAATGGPGGVLPAGTTGQTLYNNGSAWTASSALTNDGTNVGISGNLSLPNTTGSAGQITFGGNWFIHDYGIGSTFAGTLAGNFSLTGFYNTGIGFESLFAIGGGSYNTGVGASALVTDSSGANNTAVGASALASNVSASQNTAVGSGALANQSYDPGSAWASDNTAVGYTALASNQPTGTGDGIDNTAVGSQALQANTSGFENTGSGYLSLPSNTTGYYNTASGSYTGQTNTTGSENTFLGAYSDAANNNLFNATAIGFDAHVDATNHVRIGSTSVTQIGGQVAWSNLSDARAKSNIRDLDLGLDFVLALRPVAFTLKTGDGRTDMGFLAQDVEAVLGDGYSVLGIGADKDRTLSLRYTDLIAPLVKAVQEQQAQIESRDSRIAALEAGSSTQQELTADLAKTIQAQQAQIEELRRQVQMLVEARNTAATVVPAGGQ